MTRRFDAVIFDMDGTLIEQALDFQAIRSELGISPQDGVLEAIEQMPPADAAVAHRSLLEHELAAAREADPIPGAMEIVARIRRVGLKTALLTRNSRAAMEMMLEKFADGEVEFDLTWSREDAPIKPGPEGVLRACGRLGVEPDRTCCVGDFWYDVAAANAAGATSVLLTRRDNARFADEADYAIHELTELTEILGI